MANIRGPYTHNSKTSIIHDLVFHFFYKILAYKTPQDSKSMVLIVVGTSVGASIVCLFLTLGILWWKGCLESKTSREKGITKLL